MRARSVRADLTDRQISRWSAAGSGPLGFSCRLDLFFFDLLVGVAEELAVPFVGGTAVGVADDVVDLAVAPRHATALPAAPAVAQDDRVTQVAGEAADLGAVVQHVAPGPEHDTSDMTAQPQRQGQARGDRCAVVELADALPSAGSLRMVLIGVGGGGPGAARGGATARGRDGWDRTGSEGRGRDRRPPGRSRCR